MHKIENNNRVRISFLLCSRTNKISIPIISYSLCAFFVQKYVMPVSQSLLMLERHDGKEKLLEGEILPPSCLEAATGNYK